MVDEYSIDVVFDISKKDYIQTISLLENLTNKYNASKSVSYFEPDIEQKRKTCVFTATFSEIDMYGLILFIREIKTITKIYIESIYKNENKILFASKSYLKQLHKKTSKELKETLKKKYCDSNSILINEIRNIYN
jgi:hypothetical protein